VSDRKNKIVSKHAKGVEFLMKKNKVDWIKGFARLIGTGKVEVTATMARSKRSRRKTSCLRLDRLRGCCRVSSPIRSAS
jgi:pyruvate/2-oxoglutarate dehydrogenase complex dihydrolipoamide dehydrogenase (E3) component